MHPISRAAAVLAVSALAWACSTEPNQLQGGDPDKIIADPVVLLVPQFTTEEILVRVVDRQGTSLESEIAVSAPGTGIEVTADPLFRPVYAADGALTANTNNTEVRLEVDGLALGSTTFTLTGGGLSQVVTVTVVPADLDDAFAPAAPLAGDTVTISLPAGLRLGPGFTFTSARGDNPIFVDVPLDSLSARVILAPNATTPDVLANGVLTLYNPAAGAFNGLPLRALPPVATGSVYAGAGACGSAPTIGTASAFWDLAPTNGGPDRFYAFTSPTLTPPPVAPNTTPKPDTLFVRAQPSASNAALDLSIMDVTCTTVIATTMLGIGTRVDTLTSATLPAGTYKLRVTTATVVPVVPPGAPPLPPSPDPAAIRLSILIR